MISYQTAYLKAHFNVEFMAALLSHEIDDSDKILKNLAECRKQGITVLGPDLNQSGASFSVRGDKIRYGLEAVKGVGEKAVESVLSERSARGDFSNLSDLVTRINLSAVNRRVLDNFIKCGALDFSGDSRRQMLESLDLTLKRAQSAQAERASNQISLFGSVAAENPRPVSRQAPTIPEWPINQKLAYEREALGFYISGHPLEKFRGDLKRIGAAPIAQLKLSKGQREVRAGGVVTLLKLKNTKKGDRYANFMLEDHSGTIETLVWPETYKQVHALLVSEDPVVISGKIDGVEERRTFIANKVESLILLRDKNAKLGLLALKEYDHFEERLDTLLSLLKRHHGPCPVKVKLDIGGGEIALALKHRDSNPVSVIPSEVLCDEVEQLFGRPVLSFV